MISLVGVLAMIAGAGFAAEIVPDLTPAAAVRLVALKANVPEKSIEIPFIIDGVTKLGNSFEASHVRRVAAIHAVPKENGGLRRSLIFYDLLWNESLGWFMWESREERTGEAVYLWTERKGHIVNR